MTDDQMVSFEVIVLIHAVLTAPTLTQGVIAFMLMISVIVTYYNKTKKGEA